MAIQNEIIHLGEIKWFGSHNNKTGDYNRYGFLQENIYFKSSALKSENVDEYIHNGLKRQQVFYSLLQEDKSEAGANWVKLISEMTSKELADLYRQNDSVKQILDDPKQYISILQYPAIQSLFHEILQNIGIHNMLAGIQNCTGIPYDAHAFIKHNFPWNKMTRDEVAEYFIVISPKDRERVELLNNTFPIWIDENRILEAINDEDFPQCIKGALEKEDYESVYRLFTITTNMKIKSKIVSYLPSDLFLLDSDFCSFLSDYQIPELLMKYSNWQSDSVTEKIRNLLPIIEPFGYPESAIILGKQFLENKMPLYIWKQFNNTEKVWFILFLSLHLEKREIWKRQFDDIFNYENEETEEKNKCVLAALEFLEISLVDELEKQAVFDKGHKLLEEAMFNDYTNIGHPSTELMQLICRCKKDASLVCAARYWKKNNTIWCSTDRGVRTCFKKRDSDEIDLHQTSYSNLCDIDPDIALRKLSMADLLYRIEFTPALKAVYSPAYNYVWEFEEYPYRIGGRILQLNRLFAHMHCRCGKVMKSDYGYTVKINSRMSITRAYCEDVKTQGDKTHDSKVYLNECWNCGEVIDSRECHFKQGDDGQYYPVENEEIDSFYVCMNCGAGVKDIPPAVCPSCGCTEQDKLKINNSSAKKGKFIECKQCGYSSKLWESPFELIN